MLLVNIDKNWHITHKRRPYSYLSKFYILIPQKFCLELNKQKQLCMFPMENCVSILFTGIVGYYIEIYHCPRTVKTVLQSDLHDCKRRILCINFYGFEE